MSSGIWMLFLSCLTGYAYLRLTARAKETEQEQTPEAAPRPWGTPSSLLQTTSPQAALSLDTAPVGTILEILDAGPEMRRLSLQVTRRHLVKTGFQRRVYLEGDSGEGVHFVTPHPVMTGRILVSLDIIPLDALPVGKSQLQTLSPDAELSYDWKGTRYLFNGKTQRTLCSDGNELEAELLTCWQFEGGDTWLEITRESNGSYEGRLYAVILPTQLSLLESSLQ